MKRYWVFALYEFDRIGGLGDLAGTADTLGAANAVLEAAVADCDLIHWYYILDSVAGTLVRSRDTPGVAGFRQTGSDFGTPADLVARRDNARRLQKSVTPFATEGEDGGGI